MEEKDGAAGALLESLRLCNNDVRLQAAQNIVVMGGGATIPGELSVMISLFELFCRRLHALLRVSTVPLTSCDLSMLLRRFM